MDSQKCYGLYLYQKDTNQIVLKDLLQLIKSLSPRKNVSFAFIEAENSLLPQLSLWENLQIEIGNVSQKEFLASLNPELFALFNTLKNPHIKAIEANDSERFYISLLKGIIGNSNQLLIDINEDSLSPFIVSQIKKVLLNTSKSKKIFLASTNTTTWVDCAHTLVRRESYNFIFEKLNSDVIKRAA